MEVAIETPVKKPKRLTSAVWNHFERVRKADICYAVCIHCKKKLSGSSNSGTTHLRNHLIRCLKRSNFDVSQILAAKRKRKDNNSLDLPNVSYDEVKRKAEAIIPIAAYRYDNEQKKDEPVNLGSIKFDQERSRLDLARMIMLHGYPLGMVDHLGFKIFVKNLQPSFEILTNNGVEFDCMKIYEREKQKVYEMLRNFHGRISMAVGKWVSSENEEYMCLTANFVDADWKFQKKTLNFITLDSSHTDDTLSEVVIKCLMNWEIDRKLFSLTFDDCSINDEVARGVKDWISQNKPLLKNGELFDVRCASHLLKSLVREAVEALQEVCCKIRETIRYVKSSQATQGKFYEIANEVGINSEKRLFLDTPMTWNSTYLMLETALEYRGAFSLLQEHDPAYYTTLSEEDWELASSVTSYMKLFVEIINVFTINKHPTANIYFPEICDVHIQLIDWCKSPNEFICSMAMKMKMDFDKYWSKCRFSLTVAAILDPRFKMKLVEYYYPQIYSSGASNYIKQVSDGMRELYNEYSVGSACLDQGCSNLPSTSNGTRDRLRGFDMFLHETSQSHSIVSDLEKYLEEPIFPRNHDFNILNWWKVHTARYPILSMMARDILCIPFSSLTSELAFSTHGRVLDNHLTSLNADTREALVCGQDWMRIVESEDPNQFSSLAALPVVAEAS